MLYFVILGFFMLLSWLVSAQLKRKFAQYSQVPMNLSGKEVAERMLAQHDIHDVKVISVAGQLTDHYHPLKKTVNLSEPVYNARSLAAVAVAAHECGHAVQHATAYSALGLRSALVPVVSVASKFQQYVILAGFIMMGMQILPGVGFWVAVAGVVLFGFSTLFSFVTLPVEFDASRRALVWLDKSGVAFGEQQIMARDALKWAAMTYVVAALASLAQLAYWIMVLMRRR